MRTDAARNRSHLLDVARRMADDGTPPPLNELARQAGVGVATVYRHFPDANALAEALMEAPLAALGALLDRAAREPSIDVALRALFLDALSLQIENPLMARLIHQPDPAVGHHFAALQRTADVLVRRAHRAKAIRKEVSAEDLCNLLLGVHAAARGASDPVSAAHRYAEIVLAGLRATDARSRARARDARR